MKTPPSLSLPSSAGAKASNLAFALGCLPPQRRRDALIFYGFCRAVDDIADATELTSAEKKEQLAAWKNAVLIGKPSLPEELQDVIQRQNIPPHLLAEIIRGVESDIEYRQPATFEALRAYCWQVASAVGLVSIRIFGCREDDSRIYAEQLGYALQLTNILRDVGEDAKLGRIYLPAEDMHRFHVTDGSLYRGSPDGDFVGLMRFEAQRARTFFAEARRHLSDEDAKALTPAEMMHAIYERILSRMERDGFRVFECRYRIGKLEKLSILLASHLRSALRPAAALE